MSWTLSATHSTRNWDNPDWPSDNLVGNAMTVDTWAEAESWWECWSLARNVNRTVSTLTDNSTNTVVRVSLD